MRRGRARLVCAVVVAGCGDVEDAARPAAATDTTCNRQPLLLLRPSAGSAPASSAGSAERDDGSVLHGTYKRLNGEPEDLARYRGKVVLVVNTATECGYTPQFEGLEALYRSRRGDGLVVLGFPANDFAGQEPRSDKDIATFCKANYGVSFPMFAKTRVVGDGANALYPHADRGGRRARVELQQVPRWTAAGRSSRATARAPSPTPRSSPSASRKLLAA